MSVLLFGAGLPALGKLENRTNMLHGL